MRRMPFAIPTWGEIDPAAFTRIVVLSPHFDDAAMGAGHLLASYPDTTVVTVLAGPPPAYPDPPSDWDALGGFKAGDADAFVAFYRVTWLRSSGASCAARATRSWRPI